MLVLAAGSPEVHDGLLCPTLLNLPLLPAPWVAIPVPTVGLQVATELPASPLGHVGLSPSRTIALSSVLAILCSVWTIGVGWSLSRLLTAWHRTRQMRKHSQIIDCVSLTEQLEIQARLFGLRKSPELLEVPGCGSPMLDRHLSARHRDTYGDLSPLDRTERTMVLGHELAHIFGGVTCSGVS